MASKKPLVVASEIEQLQSGDTLNIGDYDVPAAIGANGTILQVDAGAAAWDTPGNLHIDDMDYYVELTGNDSDDGSVGNPWETVDHAIEEIAKVDFLNSAKATLHIGDGFHTISTNVTINKTASNLLIRGVSEPLVFAMSELDTVTAEGGDEYSLRLTLNTTAGLTTDQCVGIIGAAKWYLAGGWKITTIHDGTDITIRMGCENHLPVAGVSAATLRVNKTTLNIAADRGFDVRADNIQFSNLTLVGTGSNRGIYAHAVAGLQIVEEVLFNDFSAGLETYQTYAKMNDSYASFCHDGLYSKSGCRVEVVDTSLSFCGYGAKCTDSSIFLTTCYIVGNEYEGVDGLYFGFTQVNTCQIRGNLIGIGVWYLSHAYSITNAFSNNGTNLTPVPGEGNFLSYMRDV